MKRLIIVLGIFLAACGQAPVQTQIVEVTKVIEQPVEVTRIVPQTVEVDRVVPETVEVTRVVTQIVEKIETVEVFLEATLMIPTATIPDATNPELTTDKAEGVWLVNTEVAVGLWRASGDCYAVTYDKTGEQMDMADGSRSIISVPTNAFTVEFISYPGQCTWSYLGD